MPRIYVNSRGRVGVSFGCLPVIGIAVVIGGALAAVLAPLNGFLSGRTAEVVIPVSFFALLLLAWITVEIRGHRRKVRRAAELRAQSARSPHWHYGRLLEAEADRMRSRYGQDWHWGREPASERPDFAALWREAHERARRASR
jgi:hypothetical protein